VSLDATSESSVQEMENGSYTLVVNSTGQDVSLERRFLFVNSRKNSIGVSGVIEHNTPGCEPVSIVVESVNGQGEVVDSTTPILVPFGRSEFSFSLTSATADYSLLTISGGPRVSNVVVTGLEVDAETQEIMDGSRMNASTILAPGLLSTPEFAAAPNDGELEGGQLALRAEPTDGFIDTVCEMPVGLGHNPIEVSSGTTIQVKGWAVDKAAAGVAGAVLIMVDEQIPIRADYGLERADVAEVLGSPAYLNSGFTVNIPAELLSPGRHTLTLRVVSHDGQFYYQPTPGMKIVVRVRDQVGRSGRELRPPPDHELMDRHPRQLHDSAEEIRTP
jgi:hypothetical protein